MREDSPSPLKNWRSIVDQDEKEIEAEENKYKNYYKNKSFRTFKSSEYDKYYNKKTWCKWTNEQIESLHPVWRENVNAFINEVQDKTGIKLRIGRFPIPNGFRTPQEQKALKLIGRSSPNDKRKPVTNAGPWQSYHNFGQAFDISIIYENGTYEKDGKKALEIIKKYVLEIAEKYGFEWGGKFGDNPHFQMKFNHTTEQLKAKIDNKICDGKYPILEITPK